VRRHAKVKDIHDGTQTMQKNAVQISLFQTIASTLL